MPAALKVTVVRMFSLKFPKYSLFATLTEKISDVLNREVPPSCGIVSNRAHNPHKSITLPAYGNPLTNDFNIRWLGLITISLLCKQMFLTKVDPDPGSTVDLMLMR